MLAILLALPMASGAGAANGVPVGQQPFTLDYDLVYRNGVLKQDWSLLPPAGPFDVEWFRQLRDVRVTPALGMCEGDNPDAVRIFALGSERWRVERRYHGDDLPSFRGGFAWRPEKYCGVLVSADVDRAKALDPAYTGKKYHGLTGDLETAALFFRTGNVAVTIGRLRSFWGPQRVNLLISETAEPLDLLSLAYGKGRLTFNFLFARLDQSRPDSADFIRFPGRTFNDNRYLAAHRLDLRLHHRLRLGLFEAVIFGGEGRSPELYYLNPLHFFHAAQLNNKVDDNTILGLDLTILPGKGILVYGQLLVDDLQIDDKSQGDQEPNEFGMMAGLFRAGQIGNLAADIKLEYIRITNRTYHQRDPRNRYLYRDRPLGHPLGPDADSLSVKARLWPQPTMFAEIELAYRRHGEGSLHTPWDEPWMVVEGGYDEPFPTGVVEKSLLIAIRSQGSLPLGDYARRHFYFSLDAGWGNITNAGHSVGRSTTVARIDMILTWLGFTDISID